jgi:hypothetical protein
VSVEDKALEALKKLGMTPEEELMEEFSEYCKEVGKNIGAMGKHELFGECLGYAWRREIERTGTKGS